MKERLLGGLARRLLHGLGRRRLPTTSGRLTVPGLESRVEVLRDRWGVPHLFARSRHDLFHAQGFVHAQDRLWQMELSRRTAQGRLSELFGELTLDTDRAARTFGFHRLAEADWARSSAAARAAAAAYAAGVNAFLDGPAAGRLPLEFSLIRRRPAAWRPADTIAIGRFMAWQLSHGWQGELVRERLIRLLGPERAAELDVRYPESSPVTLPDGVELNAGPLLGGEPASPFLGRGKGSNAVAVARDRCETGGPLLANDLHLELRLPSTWHEMHLSAEDFEAAGATLPGTPLVLVGHNARVAWGITLAYTDCEDLFIERFDPRDPGRYLFRDEWLAADTRVETILVRGRGEPHRERVVVTRHGPVVSDVVGSPDHRLAVQSMALRPEPMLDGFLGMNEAAGWDDFVEALRAIKAPQLNVTYADVEGNIGYWVSGAVPVRAAGDGRVPVPGWTGEHEWVGEVPFDEMPCALNPRRGLVVSCNHRILGDEYPHYLGDIWMNGYRARRIEELVAELERVSLEDCAAIQSDLVCLPGLEFARRLDGVQAGDPGVADALSRLRAWDGRLTADSVAGCIYEVARQCLTRELFEAALGPELTRGWRGEGFDPILNAVTEFYGHDVSVLLRVLDDPDSWWLNRAGGRDAVLGRSLAQAVRWLRAELGPDPARWQWGRIHSVRFVHPLGLRKPLDRVFNRGDFPVGGDTDTPCQMAVAANGGYDVKAWGPTYRQIHDLSDWSRSLAMHAPGQSGHLASPHYDDLIEPWLRGEYHPVLWNRPDVERETVARLTLEAAPATISGVRVS